MIKCCLQVSYWSPKIVPKIRFVSSKGHIFEKMGCLDIFCAKINTSVLAIDNWKNPPKNKTAKLNFGVQSHACEEINR